jgi:regulator of PEP synthase PpsR (kinase-PPPase family)
MLKKRHVFCISDGTGITATMFCNSLLSQFEHTDFIQSSHPYVDTAEKAQKIVSLIQDAYAKDNAPPIVFTTIVKPELSSIIQNSPALTLDFFDSFIGPLEKTLGEKSSHTIGRSHGMVDYTTYKKRMDALNFSLSTDDGAGVHQYKLADVILVGVSRCGKTPTSLYLSMQYGLFVANYPITDEEINQVTLPKSLAPYKSKLFGLTIDLEQLISIRTERRPNSQYASKEQCRLEIQNVEQLFQREKIPFLNSTFLSIEELATKIKHYFS